MREEFTRNPFTKLAALRLPVLRAFTRRLDPRRYNGASLLGLRGIVVKSHGSADVFAFGQALERAVEEVRNSVPQRIDRRPHGAASAPPSRRAMLPMIYSRIAAPAATCRAHHDQRRVRRALGHERRLDPRAHRHRPAPHRREDADSSDLALEARKQRVAGGRRGGRGHRPDHRRDLDAGLRVSEHRVPAAGEARREGQRGVRRAGGVQRLRLRLATAPTPSSSRAGTSKALVVGAEVFSRILDWNDRGTCVLFGDGAGAVVLEPSDEARHSCQRAARRRQPCRHAVGAGQRVRRRIVRRSPFLQMDGQAVFKFAVKVLGGSARETVAAAGMQLADIDWLIPHQANVRILEATARKLGCRRRSSS